MTSAAAIESTPPAAPIRRGTPVAPNLTGALGLLHTPIADVGPVHQLRAALRGEFFSASDFLIAGDSNRRLAGGLTVGFTLRPDLELFVALLNSSNRNRREREAADRDPELIKTFGDLVVGGKWILPLAPGATLGAELGLKFLSGVSDLAVSPSSTSWWLGPLFTADLRRLARLPLRVHAAASFYADNSSNLYDLTGVARSTKEVAMFAYGIAPSRLRLALAVDAPLDDLIPGVPLDPFIEYHAAYVTADADPAFRDYMAPLCGGSDPASKPCLDNRDQQFLTIGARADVYRGITVDVGLDLRLHSPGFPYGPPLPPWNLMFGVSYPLDIDALTRPVVVTRVVPAPPAPPTEGRLSGFVRSARDGSPITAAVVAVVGRPRARASTDPDGGFTTPEVPLGPVELEVTAVDFAPARMAVTVAAGAPVTLEITLAPTPPVARLHGVVKGADGKGLEALLRFAGPDKRETHSDARGAYSLLLPPGEYVARVEAAALPPRELSVIAEAGQDRQVDFELRVPTPNPNVVLAGRTIKLKQPIRFAGATATLAPASRTLLNGVADLLEAHPELKRLRIEAHWDSGLPKPAAAELTQQQAEAVRSYLMGRGIAAARLEATGVGGARPLVPNLTPTNRARNRRVELQLGDQ